MYKRLAEIEREWLIIDQLFGQPSQEHLIEVEQEWPVERHHYLIWDEFVSFLRDTMGWPENAILDVIAERDSSED